MYGYELWLKIKDLWLRRSLNFFIEDNDMDHGNCGFRGKRSHKLVVFKQKKR